MEYDALRLTTAIARGDEASLAELYRAWFDWMYAEARRVTGGSEDDCLDIVHDAMLRVIRGLKPLSNDAALASWLRKTVRSCAIDRVRAEQRRRRREARSAAPRAEPRSTDGVERGAWLRRQLQELGPEERGLLFMRHRLGWTLARIGADTGLTTGGVDGRLRRLVAMLRRRGLEEFRDA